MQNTEVKYKIGLVLSGGGVRGFAHLGVLQALHERGIYPDVISGTSAGALAGVLYCDGYSPKEIFKIMKSSSWLNYMRPTLPRYGLLQISGITKILESHLHAKTYNELKVPLYVAATDLNHGKVVYFSEGELTRRRASLVNNESLAQKARDMGIGNFLLLGKGEQKQNGDKNPTNLANAVEALIGAVYLDSNLGTVRKFILKNVFNEKYEF